MKTNEYKGHNDHNKKDRRLAACRELQLLVANPEELRRYLAFTRYCRGQETTMPVVL